MILLFFIISLFCQLTHCSDVPKLETIAAKQYALELEQQLFDPQKNYAPNIRTAIASALFENLLANENIKGETYTLQNSYGIGEQSSIEKTAVKTKFYTGIKIWDFETNTISESNIPDMLTERSFGISFDNKCTYSSGITIGIKSVIQTSYCLEKNQLKRSGLKISDNNIEKLVESIYNPSEKLFTPIVISSDTNSMLSYVFLIPSNDDPYFNLHSISFNTIKEASGGSLEDAAIEKTIRWQYIDNDIVGIILLDEGYAALIYNPTTKELTTLDGKVAKEQYNIIRNDHMLQVTAQKPNFVTQYADVINKRLNNFNYPQLGGDSGYTNFDFTYLRYLQYFNTKNESRVLNLLPQKLLRALNFINQKYQTSSTSDYPNIDIDAWYVSHAQRKTDIFKKLTEHFALYTGAELPDDEKIYSEIIKKISPEIKEIHPLIYSVIEKSTDNTRHTYSPQATPPSTQKSYFYETLASIRRGLGSFLWPKSLCERKPWLCTAGIALMGAASIGVLSAYIYKYSYMTTPKLYTPPSTMPKRFNFKKFGR